MTTIFDIPEVGGSRGAAGMVRIPPGVDVPLTRRVRRLIDTPAFRRLSHISQLGLVRLVYPAANHSRQEHSLGVFLAAIEYLHRLAADERFVEAVTPKNAESLLAAALLHDIGHFPFGHPIEDLQLPQVAGHEELACHYMFNGEVAAVLREDWELDLSDVVDLVCGRKLNRTQRILCSILSGPIDVDKIDYLMRDSLHAGVPYGQNFDRRRLIGSLCLNEGGDALAITDKGKTAAEMMVFARYVMFSEVYWHHAVRSATAMLQRAVFMLFDLLKLNVDHWTRFDEPAFIEYLLALAAEDPAGELLNGIFQNQRALYKRLAQYSYIEEPHLYAVLARRPYAKLVEVSQRIAAMLQHSLGRTVAAHDVLVDAPPAEREVEFNIDVYYPKQKVYRPLGDVSPVVRTLAQEQFDDYVKRVRVFVHPRLAEAALQLPGLSDRLARSIEGD